MILLLVSSAILAMRPLGTDLRAVPDLPIGYIDLSLGPQDPRGSGDSKGGLGGPWPPQIFACPPVCPPNFFLIYRSSSFG